jgi:acetolactate synthase-1/2/3 large subunit
LRDVDNLVLIDAKAPVAFFAYPGKPSEFAPPGCSIHSLAPPGDDSVAALVALRDEIGASEASPELAEYEPPALPEGAISSEKLGALLCAMIPENAIVVDEAITTGRAFYDLTRNARPHDLIQNMGGSIGYGLPVATGAAIACPDRKVICLESDGSGMYMPQALWTQARENLDVTTLLFANRAYRILSIELANVGAEPGKNAKNMIDIDRPTLDWCGLARSMGVTAHRAASMEEVALRLEEGLRSGGPNLIEVVL